MVAKVETNAEENSTTEAQSQAESLTEATPTPESELNPTSAAVDEATQVTGDEKAQTPL